MTNKQLKSRELAIREKHNNQAVNDDWYDLDFMIARTDELITKIKRLKKENRLYRKCMESVKPHI